MAFPSWLFVPSLIVGYFYDNSCNAEMIDLYSYLAFYSYFCPEINCSWRMKSVVIVLLVMALAMSITNAWNWGRPKYEVTDEEARDFDDAFKLSKVCKRKGISRSSFVNYLLQAFAVVH